MLITGLLIQSLHEVRPVETRKITVEPAGTTIPAAGFVAITTSAG
jgi:hypothetical protein